MTALTIQLTDERLTRLKSAAEKLGLTIESYVERSIESALERKESISSTFDYILQKNTELYRRLAQ